MAWYREVKEGAHCGRGSEEDGGAWAGKERESWRAAALRMRWILLIAKGKNNVKREIHD